MSSPSLPQAPQLFTHSPESVTTLTEDVIARNKKLVDSIVQNVSVGNAEFSNVLYPLVQARGVMSLEMNAIGFIRAVSPDSRIRDAANSAEKTFSDYRVELSMREDVFVLVEAVYNKQKDDPALEAEDLFLLKDEYRAFTRAGLALPLEKRNRLQEIKKRLPELYIAYSKNISNDKSGLWFKLEELSGVPEDLLETLEKGEKGSENEGKVKLSFKATDLRPTLKHCKIAETRKKMYLGSENRCPENMLLLKEAIMIRDEAARILGYADHATFALEDKMAQKPKTVNDLLDDLRTRLAKGAQHELDELKQLKKKDVNSIDPDHYYLWDQSFYDGLMLEQNYRLDLQKLSEYFPLQSCIDGMLSIFSKLFDLVFVNIEGKDRDIASPTGEGEDIVWHPDVHLFSVWKDDGESNPSAFVGYLYMDLHPREGKFGGAANFTLRQGSDNPDGSGRRFPATTLVCSFTNPTATKPSLLKHSEMVTMFHELGHGMHNLVSETKYGCFHGTNTKRDFVEAPSQMLENWCWVSSQIKPLSKHWSYLSPEYEKAYLESVSDASAARPDEKMPDEMIDSLIRTRYVNESLFKLRSVHLSKFDMMIHQPASREDACTMDVSRLYNKLRHDICMLEDLGEEDDYHWAQGAATFTHIMAGYDVCVYGYTWSEVYATDMFHNVFGKDPMDKEAGRRYRDMVLKPGGSREPMDLLKDLLGREPSAEAFYEVLGIA